jgi:Right handed beta helix region
MRTLGIVVATLLATSASVAVAGPPPQTNTFTVDCSRQQTISEAITRGDERKPLVINVLGTCNEHVTISRDDVTLRGQPGGEATVTGPDSSLDTILILKDTVNIEDLTVTGGFNGIRLQGPSYAGVTNVLVRNTANHGIIVRAGDIAIMNSTVEYAGGSGVMLARGASARIVNSNFRDCHITGITADGSSTVGVSGGTVSNNEGTGVTLSSGSQGGVNNAQVLGNAAHGVLAQAGAVLNVYNSKVRDNGEAGVFGYLGATVVMGGNEITDNGGTGVLCMNDCTLQISGDRITRNGQSGISVLRRSTLIVLEPPTDASGNNGGDLWCGDKESSVDLGANFTGNVDSACTGFND